uniref:Uncharacterized protein n=1 Tax=Arundo donax TaxID=35708 RepID=A0A0A9CZU3_ARUDO
MYLEYRSEVTSSKGTGDSLDFSTQANGCCYFYIIVSCSFLHKSTHPRKMQVQGIVIDYLCQTADFARWS